MPFAGFSVARAWLKPYPDLFLGLCLVGCSPGTCLAARESENPCCR
jgi:hypothetical protein